MCRISKEWRSRLLTDGVQERVMWGFENES